MKNKVLISCMFISWTILLSGADINRKQVIYLSGKGYDNTKTWDFFCTGGRNSGVWTKIEVPSCWEQQGFGNYEYGRNSYSYGPKYKYADEKGMYKVSFPVPADWKGKEINIVFDGSMTDTEVKINGKLAGEVHRGAFYRFKYNITDKLNFGQTNLLEVTVSKLSSDESVNRAERYGDYWNFGGIFRPVFLEVLPKEYIERVAINAKDDGSFSMDIFPENIASKREIIAEIVDVNDKIAGTGSILASPGDSLLTIKFKVNNPVLWTSETPELYKVNVYLKEGKKELYTLTEKFGFRTVEVRHGDGIYLNGTKIKMKGINRHSFWPESGRTLNREICLNDVKLIKEMNMNAVRMSHYPPDVDFLDICDSLGLFVLDEIAGWQRAYDTPVGKNIVKETVIRDVNHPSVLFWDNGNEGGTNKELDKEFLIYDPSKRDVLHAHHRPDNDFNGIDCNHYETYSSAANILKDSLIYMTTEFLHCQDDGGGGSGLYDYWELLWSADRSAGGFLWALVDEGLVRTDMNGFIDTDGVNGPDGVMGPHREKEGSFFAIREIFSPVHITMKEIPTGFTGAIPVENRYHFTNFNQCLFKVKLVTYNRPSDWLTGYNKIIAGAVASPSIEPGGKGIIGIKLPADWQNYEALILTAYDPFNNEIYSWTWQIRKNKQIIEKFINVSGEKTVETVETDSSLTLRANGTSFMISKKDGKILKVTYNNRTNIQFNNGPVITTGNATLSGFRHFAENDGYVAEINYTGDLKSIRWKMYPSGWISLDYQYELTGNYQFAGISFSYPENWIIRAKWLGEGPYRVWKNRMKGVHYNVWGSIYNNTQTGAFPFFYPEFKGYFSDFTWIELSTAQGKILMASEDEGLFLRLYNFYGITGPKSYPELPPGDISFLDCIPALGSKLATGLTTDASVYGPAGKLNELSGIRKHKLWFYFGVPDINPQNP
jgi:hypothetical protein